MARESGNDAVKGIFDDVRASSKLRKIIRDI
jgi:hypothetical protein